MKIEMIRRPSDGFWSFRLYDELGDEGYRCSWWFKSRSDAWDAAITQFDMRRFA